MKTSGLSAADEKTSVQTSSLGAVSMWEPAFAVALAAIILLVLSGCIGKTQHAYAQHPDVSPELDEAISSAIISRNENYTGEGGGELGTEGHVVLAVDGDVDEEDGEVEVYALVDFCEYGFEDGNFVSTAWYQNSAVFTFTRSDDGLYCTDYVEAPEPTAGGGDWVRKAFPACCSEEAIAPSSEDKQDM